jgi:hypothetical protein
MQHLRDQELPWKIDKEGVVRIAGGALLLRGFGSLSCWMRA